MGFKDMQVRPAMAFQEMARSNTVFGRDGINRMSLPLAAGNQVFPIFASFLS